MEYLAFRRFGKRRYNKYTLNVDHYRGCLRYEDIELEESCMGLIFI
jgi:hypothetical protein